MEWYPRHQLFTVQQLHSLIIVVAWPQHLLAHGKKQEGKRHGGQDCKEKKEKEFLDIKSIGDHKFKKEIILD
jgi:hypothetical protein